MTTLPAKDGNPVLDAGSVQAHLEANGIPIGVDGVTAHSDGAVTVDAGDSTELQAAWASYEVPE